MTDIVLCNPLSACNLTCPSFIHPLTYEYDILVQQHVRERMDEIVEVMMGAVCTRKEYIRVDGDEKPAEIVKSRLLKLDSSHILLLVHLSITSFLNSKPQRQSRWGSCVSS